MHFNTYVSAGEKIISYMSFPDILFLFWLKKNYFYYFLMHFKLYKILNFKKYCFYIYHFYVPRSASVPNQVGRNRRAFLCFFQKVKNLSESAVKVGSSKQFLVRSRLSFMCSSYLVKALFSNLNIPAHSWSQWSNLRHQKWAGVLFRKLWNRIAFSTTCLTL